ncbi:HlyD family type I secretion periplasmic adaptor subunit [Qingshengfaniella alkalisoli]|uniref:Membrane fusion protein (MFP) family protein n=1 Tax=Qingshengfaniella alkalisoli TaxID=2599296 RepID=A0A5B8ICI4_9RHOB|nr:HlyD family type I secretion periplasmic adaptor subunit [Qingshengfaniella alkalisoli]QDY71306.1 HlyD family type I secretion periplasmic adaptor subunit [Qingshengfaniella alkalisoli]
MSQTDMFSARRAISLGLFVLIILVGGFGAWAAFSQIAGAIIAPGQIEVDQNRQVVQHPDGGVVSEILVQEGDTVEAGDVLIRLDETLLASELSIVQGQLNELISRRGRLEAERDGTDEISFDPDLLAVAADHSDTADLIDGQRRLFEARLITLEKETEQLARRRAQIGSQIEGIVAQQDALSSQLDLLREELADQQKLMESGLAQKSRVLSLQREEARLSGTLGELLASKAESEGRITELDIEVLKLETARREEAITTLRDLQYREYELAEQRRALIEQMSRLDIRAPLGGVIYGLVVFAERSVIRAADPLLYIVPQDRPLIITSRVEPIHIDQVFPGQSVTLRFSALDSRTTPELEGTLRKVSADAFTDERTGESYYRAEVILDDGQADRLPEGTHLLPGMPVETFLRTSDRTPLAYLTKPLTDYFNKAFREG